MAISGSDRNASEGRTPALSDAQARRLLPAPESRRPQAKRDRALLATVESTSGPAAGRGRG